MKIRRNILDLIEKFFYIEVIPFDDADEDEEDYEEDEFDEDDEN